MVAFLLIIYRWAASVVVLLIIIYRGRPLGGLLMSPAHRAGDGHGAGPPAPTTAPPASHADYVVPQPMPARGDASAPTTKSSESQVRIVDTLENTAVISCLSHVRDPSTVTVKGEARLRRGATFLWCTLACMAGTPLADPIARAFAGVGAFAGPITYTADMQTVLVPHLISLLRSIFSLV